MIRNFILCSTNKMTDFPFNLSHFFKYLHVYPRWTVPPTKKELMTVTRFPYIKGDVLLLANQSAASSQMSQSQSQILNKVDFFHVISSHECPTECMPCAIRNDKHHSLTITDKIEASNNKSQLFYPVQINEISCSRGEFLSS